MKNKPLVATNTAGMAKESKILDFIGYYSPAGTNPTSLSKLTRINVNTVKSILKKLLEKGLVMKKPGLRGFYSLVEENTHSLNEWLYQNGVLVFESEEIGGVMDVVRINPLSEFIKYRFKLTRNTQKAIMHFSTDYPVNFSSIGLLVEIFIKLIEEEVKIKVDLEKVYFSTIEFNKDYNNLRLDGTKCISFTSLISQYKLYQKKTALREEVKITTQVDAKILMRLLKQGAVSSNLEVRLRDLESKIVNLLHNFDKNVLFVAREFSRLKGEIIHLGKTSNNFR